MASPTICKFLSSTTDAPNTLLPSLTGSPKRRSRKYTVVFWPSGVSMTSGYCAQSRYTRPRYERFAPIVAGVSGSLGKMVQSYRVVLLNGFTSARERKLLVSAIPDHRNSVFQLAREGIRQYGYAETRTGV